MTWLPPCPDCEEHPLGLCPTCREDMADTLADDMARARWEEDN